MKQPLFQARDALDHLMGTKNLELFIGSRTFALDICGHVFAWLFFMAVISVFYQLVPPLVRTYYKCKYPLAPTSNVSQQLIDEMIQTSYRAFPLYVCVPVCTELFIIKGWSKTCETIEDCGGILHALAGCITYFFAIEILIYAIHFYLLHKSALGKKLMRHAEHHVYKYANQLNAFSGYSFAPQDGFSQGAALTVCTLFIRVPVSFVYAMEAITGFWTLYIHSDISPMPWPFMGCDYHSIHHRYNWYNFGFMTLLCDELFRTVKHPGPDARDYAIGKKQMTEHEKRQSATLTAAILKRRGCEALALDDCNQIWNR